MKITSRAYRKLHPRGKEWRRKNMEQGGRSMRARIRQAAAEAPLQDPPAESRLTNHQRHVMRRKAREMVRDRAKELEAQSVAQA